MSVDIIAVFLLGALLMAGLARARPATTAGAKLLLFAALFVLPVVGIRAGLQTHLEASKTTEFCMSCHVMEPYGQSLLFEDDSYLPAAHFQNRRIDRDTACFTCHTQYTIFGDLTAKMNGLEHLWVYYTGQTPEKIELYEPYQNRECLHCHIGARRFDEIHAPEMDALVANNVSCMNCHGSAHAVHELDGAAMWLETLDKALEGGPIE